MGRSYTPKYRIEFRDQAGEHREAWSGNPTYDQLCDWVERRIESMKPGGVNAHISEFYGFVPVPSYARIVRQKDGANVCEWVAPRFLAT